MRESAAESKSRTHAWWDRPSLESLLSARTLTSRSISSNSKARSVLLARRLSNASWVVLTLPRISNNSSFIRPERPSQVRPRPERPAFVCCVDACLQVIPFLDHPGEEPQLESRPEQLPAESGLGQVAFRDRQGDQLIACAVQAVGDGTQHSGSCRWIERPPPGRGCRPTFRRHRTRRETRSQEDWCRCRSRGSLEERVR